MNANKKIIEIKDVSINLAANDPYFITISQLKSKTTQLINALNEIKNQLIITNKGKPIAIIMPLSDEMLSVDFNKLSDSQKNSHKESSKEIYIYNIYNNIINNTSNNTLCIHRDNSDGGNGHKNGYPQKNLDTAQKILDKFNEVFEKKTKDIKPILLMLNGTKRIEPRKEEEFYRIIDNIKNNINFMTYLDQSGHLHPTTVFRDVHWDKYLNMEPTSKTPLKDSFDKWLENGGIE